MRRSIIVKIISNIAVAVALVLFIGGAVFIKLFKGVLAESGVSAAVMAKIIEQSVIFLTVILVILIIILVGIIYFGLKKIIINPLEKLRQGAEMIAKGNLNYKIRSRMEPESEDEIDQLAESFNEMTAKLKESLSSLERQVKDRTEELDTEKGSLEKRVKERTAELERLKEKLEITVDERTKELNNKLAEVEQINSAMIGRELRMIELKKEIEELKNKLL